eukprot:4365288-Pleurochrysis_carterae.AAC.2
MSNCADSVTRCLIIGAELEAPRASASSSLQSRRPSAHAREAAAHACKKVLVTSHLTVGHLAGSLDEPFLVAGSKITNIL